MRRVAAMGCDGLITFQEVEHFISLFKGETPLDPPFACRGLLSCGQLLVLVLVLVLNLVADVD
jgi:hypothetical protein